MRLALAGLYQARWSDRILDECFTNLVANRPDNRPGSLDRTRALSNVAIPDATVMGYEPLVAALEFPDPDDRHVLAAAIRSNAQDLDAVVEVVEPQAAMCTPTSTRVHRFVDDGAIPIMIALVR